MSNSIKIVLAIVVCIFMATFTAHAATPCQTVAKSMAPCTNYLKNGGTVPSQCCDGMRTVVNAASTTALKKAYCECIKTQAKSSGVKAEFATALPAKCNVKISYPISYKTDCNSIQ